jgi:hypothetical protein
MIDNPTTGIKLNHHYTGRKHMKYLLEGFMALAFTFAMGYISYETKDVWPLIGAIFVGALYLIADWSD